MKVFRSVSFRSAAVALLWAGALGCGGDAGSGYGPADNPTMVSDVTGAAFGWLCDSSDCQVGLLAATPAPDPCSGANQPGYGYGWGRFFEICSACFPTDGSMFLWSSTPGQCRLLACDTSADCPIMFTSSPADVYECVDGLCENADQSRRPRTPLQRVDAESLCFAVHPRSETSSLLAAASVQVEAELDANCTGSDPMATCSLPSDCRQP